MAVVGSDHYRTPIGKFIHSSWTNINNSTTDYEYIFHKYFNS